MSKEIIKVPDMGGSDAVEVIEVCVAVGDSVDADQSLIVVESDKASMEIPAPFSGTVLAIKLAEGDEVKQGDLILEMEVQGKGEEASGDEPPNGVRTENIEVPQEQVKTETPKVKTSSVSKLENIIIPDIGGSADAEVIEVCVAPGEQVSEGDSLIVLETDKASMEIPAPFSGMVKELSISEGAKAGEGDLILVLEVETTESVSPDAEEIKEKAVASAEPKAVPAEAPKEEISQNISIAESKPSKNVYAGPAVRLQARELGVDLAQVSGSGPKGRILKEDVLTFVKSAMQTKGSAASLSGGMGIPPIPEVDFSQFGEISTEKMSKMHKVTAANMHRSWLNIPHVTQFDDADITELEDFRKGLKAEAQDKGVKITPMPFLLKACAAALKANPAFNASLLGDGEHLVYKKYIHIGIAVDTPAGLMVPVIRDVDKKSIWELAAETAELAQKAKERKLKPDEMRGGCFTISSLGGIGGNGFTPIVNAPEVGILGVSKLAIKPQWDGSAFVPRKMLPLSLSYDHRAVNGGDAGRFLTMLGDLLTDIRRLVL